MCSTSMVWASSSSEVPLRGVLDQQRAHRVRDLAATAVPDRDVDQHAVDVGGGLLGLLEAAGGLGGQQVEGADRVQPPAALVGERVDGVADDGEQRLELRGRAVEVVGRQQPQGDHLDAGLLAPAEQRLDVGRAGPVALRGVGADGLGPAPVAVEHHADVLGEPVLRERLHHPCLVGRVEHSPDRFLPVRHGTDATRVTSDSPASRATSGSVPSPYERHDPEQAGRGRRPRPRQAGRGQAQAARLVAPRHRAAHPGGGHRADRALPHADHPDRLRAVRGDRAGPVHRVRDLPPGHLVTAHVELPAALRPLQHLPADRRLLHARSR